MTSEGFALSPLITSQLCNLTFSPTKARVAFCSINKWIQSSLYKQSLGRLGERGYIMISELFVFESEINYAICIYCGSAASHWAAHRRSVGLGHLLSPTRWYRWHFWEPNNVSNVTCCTIYSLFLLQCSSILRKESVSLANYPCTCLHNWPLRMCMGCLISSPLLADHKAYSRLLLLNNLSLEIHHTDNLILDSYKIWAEDGEHPWTSHVFSRNDPSHKAPQ